MIPKFRAWDKRFSEFLEDFFVNEDGKIYKKTKDTSYGFAISRETSDKIILMQSTGLFDKNGKEIFEGDILTDGHTLGVLRNHQTLGFYMADEKGKENFLSDTVDTEGFEEAKEFMENSIEIIGNIYENKEVLEDNHDAI